MFSSLKETVNLYHEKLVYFVQSSDDRVEYEDMTLLLTLLEDESVKDAKRRGEEPDHILKMSYFDDEYSENGKRVEHVLLFVVKDGIVIKTTSANDIEQLTYSEIISEHMFNFSLYDLGKLNHIFQVMVSHKG